jgi:FkbM family methyltransferase
MDQQNLKKIYKKIKERKLDISHACEVGVYLPESSNILDFINEGTRSTLVEPDPSSIKAINKAFQGKINIQLHPVAVFDYKGKIELSQREASTFVSSLSSSPALVNENYQVTENDKFTVDCVTFNDIDDNTIDLLSVDTEGCEWYVLKNLTSRPSVISLETHGKFYTNAFLNEIMNWMQKNGYKIWYKDGSDSIFIKKELLDLSFPEKIDIIFQNLKIKIIQLKKVFRRFKKNNVKK